MSTARKSKAKVSFKDRYAKPQTKVWRGKMFNGDSAELEIRKVTGVQELMEIRSAVQDYAKRARELEAKASEQDEEQEYEMTEDDMAIIHEGNVVFGELLKRVVVLPEDEEMADEDWTELASNMGGLQSPLWRVVAAAVGLGTVEVEQHDLPFSSAGKEA